MGKRNPDITNIHWNGFVGDHAIFPVCMKSPSVRGSTLAAQINQARQHLNKLTILMCDSLDRHNVQDIANAEEYCIDQADKWLDKNLPMIKGYFPNVDVMRWKRDISSHPDFDTQLEKVISLNEKSNVCRSLRESMANYFLVAKKERHAQNAKKGLIGYFNSEAALETSRNYLEEEFAGDTICHKITGGLPYLYWGLYVDDTHIYAREGNDKTLVMPDTIAVTSKRHGRSVKASQLSTDGYIKTPATQQKLRA